MIKYTIEVNTIKLMMGTYENKKWDSINRRYYILIS